MQIILDHLTEKYGTKVNQRHWFNGFVNIYHGPKVKDRMDMYDVIKDVLYFDKRSFIGNPRNKGKAHVGHKKPTYLITFEAQPKLAPFLSMFTGEVAFVEMDDQRQGFGAVAHRAIVVPVFEQAADFALWELLCQRCDKSYFLSSQIGNQNEFYVDAFAARMA